jgi:hypothetical protein
MGLSDVHMVLVFGVMSVKQLLEVEPYSRIRDAFNTYTESDLLELDTANLGVLFSGDRSSIGIALQMLRKVQSKKEQTGKNKQSCACE